VSAQIVKLSSRDSLWAELLTHLRRTDHLRHLSDDQGILPAVRFLAAVAASDQVVGHLSFKVQPLLVPAEPPVPLLRVGVGLTESYVQTFLVEEAWRGRGIGAELQLAALAWSRELGCTQLRSWSSLDKQANYALKLRLGFSFCPGMHIVQRTGERIPGGWFVKQV